MKIIFLFFFFFYYFLKNLISFFLNQYKKKTIYDKKDKEMLSLDTQYPTMVHKDYIIDPSVIDKLSEESEEKRKVVYFHHTETTPVHVFITEICSGFLKQNGFQHDRNKWFMDVIRYNLKDETKRVKSGLAWHCENDNYPNVITVLMYLRIDETLKDANIRYKDRNNEKEL